MKSFVGFGFARFGGPLVAVVLSSGLLFACSSGVGHNASPAAMENEKLFNFVAALCGSGPEVEASVRSDSASCANANDLSVIQLRVTGDVGSLIPAGFQPNQKKVDLCLFPFNITERIDPNISVRGLVDSQAFQGSPKSSRAVVEIFASARSSERLAEMLDLFSVGVVPYLASGYTDSRCVGARSTSDWPWP